VAEQMRLANTERVEESGHDIGHDNNRTALTLAVALSRTRVIERDRAEPLGCQPGGRLDSR